MTAQPDQPAHGCTIDGQPAIPIPVADYNQLVADLAALRAVARGYCPDCGRGDAAPTVEDWEQQKQRADHAEATLAGVRALYERWVKAGVPPLGSSINRWWDMRLAELGAALQKTGE